jgi:hypothetical protein
MFFNGDGAGSFNLINPNKDYENVDSPNYKIDREDDRKKLDTICFHTFIILNLFNMINCRVLDTLEHSEMNVFKTLCKFKGCPPMPEHSIFWVVMGGEIFIQQLAITRFTTIFGTI